MGNLKDCQGNEPLPNLLVCVCTYLHMLGKCSQKWVFALISDFQCGTESVFVKPRASPCSINVLQCNESTAYSRFGQMCAVLLNLEIHTLLGPKLVLYHTGWTSWKYCMQWVGTRHLFLPLPLACICNWVLNLCNLTSIFYIAVYCH